MRLERLPLESSTPIVAFAVVRVMVTATALLCVAILGFPFAGALFAVLAAVALPWAAALLVLARRRPTLALHPLVVAGDFAVLVAVEAVAPETYAAVRFLALFLIAAHSHFQGDQRGLALSAGGIAALLVGGAFTDPPVSGDVRQLYEVLFAACGLATAAVVGGLRTAESAGRLRARGLTRRAFEVEDHARRRLALMLHDGPVQELASLELMLAGAAQAAERGDAPRVRELLDEAQQVTARNVRALRDEMVALGPQAFDELSFEGAVERLVPTWERVFGTSVRVECEALELPSGIEGDLFRIAHEAVTNAGRHAGASTVAIALRRLDGGVELDVSDDGHGFAAPDDMALSDRSHLGLAGMRERAEAMGGTLEIASGTAGTRVRVRVPLG
jgi:signal transduction histidine kinase